MTKICSRNTTSSLLKPEVGFLAALSAPKWSPLLGNVTLTCRRRLRSASPITPSVEECPFTDSVYRLWPLVFNMLTPVHSLSLVALQKTVFLDFNIPKRQPMWTKFGPEIEDMRRIDADFFHKWEIPLTPKN